MGTRRKRQDPDEKHGWVSCSERRQVPPTATVSPSRAAAPHCPEIKGPEINRGPSQRPAVMTRDDTHRRATVHRDTRSGNVDDEEDSQWQWGLTKGRHQSGFQLGMLGAGRATRRVLKHPQTGNRSKRATLELWKRWTLRSNTPGLLGGDRIGCAWP